MEELIAELTSPRFWIAVVLVGIAINLLSAYMRPLIDRGVSTISESYRARTGAKKEEEILLFESLVECSEFRNIHRQQAVFERTRSVWFACIGVGFFTTAILSQLSGISDLQKISIFFELDLYN